MVTRVLTVVGREGGREGVKAWGRVVRAGEVSPG